MTVGTPQGAVSPLSSFSALIAEAMEAFRTDPAYVIELAKQANSIQARKQSRTFSTTDDSDDCPV